MHACKRLFFDFGIRPSVTTVREFTQTGSASDIPKDIEAFWASLRTSMRVRIDAGGLPVALQERAGDFVTELYAQAREEARIALNAERAQLAASIDAAHAQVREADTRRDVIEQANAQLHTRVDTARAHIATLEAELKTSRDERSNAHAGLREIIARLERENEALAGRILQEQTEAARLRQRLDALQDELRHNTEHYAQQIKDAVKEAERRVKPMLVELDALRGMAATYQAGARDAGQKEFDFLQQLSAARGRADRLESQVRTQSDEIDALIRERNAHRVKAGVSAELGGLIASMAMHGRLTPGEIATIGAQIDGYLVTPDICPSCNAGEPELQRHKDEFELSCPNCERTSGAASSKLAAIEGFLDETRCTRE